MRSHISSPLPQQLAREVRKKLRKFSSANFLEFRFVSFLSHDTCPTCRQASTTTTSLIKLFFEIDDNKASLNIEDILNTNDGLSKEVSQFRKQTAELQTRVTESEAKLKETNERIKLLERQKQLDDMALAGFRTIKTDATNEILKMRKELSTLKLDLLAERQLRRLNQQTLRVLDPENEDYNPNTIKAEDVKVDSELSGAVGGVSNAMDTSAAYTNFSVPFWKLNCEAKPVIGKTSEARAYLIPSKIQKAAANDNQKNNDRLLSFRNQRSAWSKSDKKPVGFQFVPKAAEPSTSSGAAAASPCLVNSNQKRTFGENSLFSKTSTISPIVSTSQGFNFSIDTPSFAGSGTLNSGFRFDKAFSPQNATPQSAREGSSSSSPLFNKHFSFNNKKDDKGPKSSDRWMYPCECLSKSKIQYLYAKGNLMSQSVQM